MTHLATQPNQLVLNENSLLFLLLIHHQYHTRRGDQLAVIARCTARPRRSSIMLWTESRYESNALLCCRGSHKVWIVIIINITTIINIIILRLNWTCADPTGFFSVHALFTFTKSVCLPNELSVASAAAGSIWINNPIGSLPGWSVASL